MRKIRFRWTIVVASFLVNSLSNLNVARGDFNYPDFNSINGLVFNGAAGQLGDRLRLTCSGGETPAGSVYRSEPEYVAFGFCATFQSRIGEPAGIGLADGLTFIIQNSSHGPAALGSAEGGLGYSGISNSLVIEIDSYTNDDLGDPPYPHVAIHSAGPSQNGSGLKTLIGGPVALPGSIDGCSIYSLRVEYTPGTLLVYLGSLDNLILSVDVNLEDLLDLDQGRAWVGFTSGIGSGSANHDILSWSYTADTPNTFAFEIDSANSTLSLEGVAAITTVFPDFTIETETVSIMEQGLGSLTANYNGTIWVDLDNLVSPSTIIFKRASIDAEVSGEWSPSWASFGMGLTASEANYGLLAATSDDEIEVVAALRQERLDMTSAGAAATISAGGAFPGMTQIWSRKSVVFSQFSPQLGMNLVPAPVVDFNQEFLVSTSAEDGSIDVVDSCVRLTLPVSVSFVRDGVFGSVANRIFRFQWNCAYVGVIVAKFPLPKTEISANYVIHIDWSGSGSSIDSGKYLLKAGTAAQQASYDNLINTHPGIKAVAFDLLNSLHARNVTAEDFDFQVSPSGYFDEATNPPANWASAPAPTSVTVSQGSPSRILIRWVDRAIENRWLRITFKATVNTGLCEDQIYYLGHLRGKTSGPLEGVFTVCFKDIAAIRTSVGQTVDASNIFDIDKNGTISFSDISAMRVDLGKQLTNITVP